MSYSIGNKPLAVERWFWGFVGLHLLVWTLVPSLTHLNLPLDALEGATWGHQLELGYDKNPFLNAWLTAFIVWLSHYQDWAIYFSGALCTGICFWAVYRLGRKFLAPEHALLGVLLLEGIQYFNLSAMDLNDNVLEIALWPLIALNFYNAVQQQRWRDWLLVALFAGLATMAKYYVAVLLLPMLLFMLSHPMARRSFKQLAFYSAILAYLLLIAPHFIWLYQHNGVTIQYAFAKVASEPEINKHIDYALHFGLNLLAACIVPLLLFSVLYWGRKLKEPKPAKYSIPEFDWQFLLFVGAGPFIVTLLLSVIAGWALHTGWAAPLPILWGLGLVAYVQPRVTTPRFYRLMGGLATLTLLVVMIYTHSKFYAGDTSSANYPGPHMARALSQEWHARYQTRLHYVAGPRWEAGNVAYYSEDKPAVYMEWRPQVSPWIDEPHLQQQGAIFIWPKQYLVEFQQLKQRFPRLETPQLWSFTWQRNHYQPAPPLEVWVAFLPPQHAIGLDK